ncbi:MAG: DUF302 domain-containing protein [Chromatiaceae bacterium]|jgi:uncharacterized protein (DUF302 family)|nr:DUF302 domain-containing protein [Chromatiaceae bacterium]
MNKHSSTFLGLAAALLFTAGALAEPPTVVYKASGKYEDVKDAITMAIEGRGLIVRDVAHVAEMLNRTGKDLGFPNEVFRQADNVEFCSALLSHEMIAADPSNAATCPLVVSVYVLTAEPDQVYVAFRRQTLAGKDMAPIEQKLFDLVDGVVREAIE